MSYFYVTFNLSPVDQPAYPAATIIRGTSIWPWVPVARKRYDCDIIVTSWREVDMPEAREICEAYGLSWPPQHTTP